MKSLTERGVSRYVCAVFPAIYEKARLPMFKDVFDFSKKRTAKEAAVFVIFHSVLVLGAMAGLSLMGIS